MSRAFIGFGQKAYIGQPFTNPIKIGGIAGVSVPLLFQWLSYGASTAVPNINVLVNCESSACKALDQIRSVYIDNLGSSVPVYVYFPDTGQTLSAKANSEGWYPAYTNAKQCWVIGEGFLDGNIPTTYIMLSNLPLQAAVNTELDQSQALYLASPVITRGNSIYNSRLGSPALGDQFFASVPLDLSVASPVLIWKTPYPSGFLYITSIYIDLENLSNGTNLTTGYIIESTGIAGALYQQLFLATPVISSRNLLNISNMQLKLDATQTWRMRVIIANVVQGNVTLFSSFTQQP